MRRERRGRRAMVAALAALTVDVGPLLDRTAGRAALPTIRHPRSRRSRAFRARHPVSCRVINPVRPGSPLGVRWLETALRASGYIRFAPDDNFSSATVTAERTPGGQGVDRQRRR